MAVGSPLPPDSAKRMPPMPPGPGGGSPLTTMSRSAWVPVKTGMSMGTRTE